MTAAYTTEADVRRRVCGNKRRHPTRRDAREHADRLNRETGAAVYSPYPCPFADDGHWHAGHIPSLEALEATARVMRGLPPTPPEPHDPPPRTRRRRRPRGAAA